MLKFKVKEILNATGKKTPVKWLKNHCDMSEAKAYNIYNGKQKSINLKDFSKLCENLNCTPNDLMYWYHSPQTKLPETHPCITTLVVPDKLNNWYDIFRHLSPTEVIELHTLAKERVNEKKLVKPKI